MRRVFFLVGLSIVFFVLPCDDGVGRPGGPVAGRAFRGAPAFAFRPHFVLPPRPRAMPAPPVLRPAARFAVRHAPRRAGWSLPLAGPVLIGDGISPAPQIVQLNGNRETERAPEAGSAPLKGIYLAKRSGCRSEEVRVEGANGPRMITIVRC